MRQQTIPVWLEFAVISVDNSKRGCWRQRGNCKKKVLRTLTIWNHVLAKRQNVIKSIAHVTQLVGSAQTCASVMSVLIVTFTTMNLQISLVKQLIWKCSMKRKLKCPKRWILSLFNFQTFDFNKYFLLFLSIFFRYNALPCSTLIKPFNLNFLN